MPPKQDFSGEWVLNRGASTLSKGADAVKSGVWQIEHREPRFGIKASFASDGGPISFQYELPTDGSESAGTHQGGSTTSSLRWDGDALVVMFRTQSPKSDVKVSFRYELVDAGRRLRASEELRGTDHDQDNVWVFDLR